MKKPSNVLFFDGLKGTVLKHSIGGWVARISWGTDFRILISKPKEARRLAAWLLKWAAWKESQHGK